MARTAPVPVLPSVVSAPPAAPPVRAVEARGPVEGDRAGEVRAAAFAALEAGDLDAAEAQFERALKIVPRDRDASGGLGWCGCASSVLRRPGSCCPPRPRVRAPRTGRRPMRLQASSPTCKGRRLPQRGKLTEAEVTARRLAAKPQAYRIEAQLLLGDILAAQQRPAESEVAYRAAIATAPERPEARIGLAVALADQGRADEARTLARQLPDADAARALTARIERDRAARLALAGDTFGAGAALATALNADPEDPWTRYEYAKFLSAHGGQGEAAQVAAPLSGANASPEALSAAALYADSQANPEQAASLIRRIPETRRTKDISDLAARVDTDRTIREAQRLTAQGLSTRAIILLRGELANGALDFGARSRLAQALYDAGDAYQAGSMALTAAQSQLPVEVRPGDAAGFLNVLAAAGQEPAAEQLLANLQTTARSPDNQQAFVGLMTGYAIRKADRQRTEGIMPGLSTRCRPPSRAPPTISA
uniref:Tetratricopeptide repeat protein n=1 Tax=Phenylobacterium glaciei TaxID=2803784 RepID=A0A974P4U7_9CAUL|nr:tetratricopeptide repeat protein [Phenylobacterium glaciei]